MKPFQWPMRLRSRDIPRASRDDAMKDGIGKTTNKYSLCKQGPNRNLSSNLLSIPCASRYDPGGYGKSGQGFGMFPALAGMQPILQAHSVN